MPSRRPIPLLLLALGAPALAEPRQHGNVLADLPPDWTEGSSEGGTQTYIYDGPEERCTSCYLYIGLGAPAAGPLDAWLSAEALRFVDEDDRAAAEVIAPAEVIGTDPRTLAMMGLRVDGDVQMLVAVEAGGRYELLGFEGWAYDEEEVARNLGFFRSDVTALFDRFRYVSEGAEPLMPEPVPGDLSGLWWGWFQNLRIGLDGMAVPYVDQRRLAFWPDGRFYDGAPPQGLAAPDARALATPGEGRWGVYRAKGGALVLTYADGEVETLRAEDGGWSDGSRVLTQVEPLPDGARLDGTVEDFSYTGFTPGSGIEGGVASESSTTFRPDGTYAGESFGGAFGNFTDGGGSVTGGFATDGGTEATDGTYEVRDGLLVMRPADGSAPTAEIAHEAGGDVAIGELFLEGRVLPPK